MACTKCAKTWASKPNLDLGVVHLDKYQFQDVLFASLASLATSMIRTICMAKGCIYGIYDIYDIYVIYIYI